MKRPIVFALQAAAILPALLAAGCLPPAPAPIASDAAAVAISLEGNWTRFGIAKEIPERVYFIRWKDSDDVTAHHWIVQSNFSRDGRVYLLNARPGRYSAVAATSFNAAALGGGRPIAVARAGAIWESRGRRGRGASAGSGGPGAAGPDSAGLAILAAGARRGVLTARRGPWAAVSFAGAGAGLSFGFSGPGLLLAQRDASGGESEGQRDDEYQAYTTYFPEALIRKTAVTVAPGDFKVMGSFVFDMEISRTGGDRVQSHFFRSINPHMDDPNGMPLQRAVNSVAVRGSLVSEKRDPAEEAAFLRNALQDLRDTDWAPLLQRRLDAMR